MPWHTRNPVFQVTVVRVRAPGGNSYKAELRKLRAQFGALRIIMRDNAVPVSPRAGHRSEFASSVSAIDVSDSEGSQDDDSDSADGGSSSEEDACGADSDDDVGADGEPLTLDSVARASREAPSSCVGDG